MDEKRLIEQAAVTGHTVMVTQTVSKDELRAIMEKPLCPTCRWFVYLTARVAGKPSEWPDCDKKIIGFPDMTLCHQFQREPGSDDE